MSSFATPQTGARQASLSMAFSEEDIGVGCYFFLQGTFPTQGSNIARGVFTTEPPGKSILTCRQRKKCSSDPGVGYVHFGVKAEEDRGPRACGQGGWKWSGFPGGLYPALPARPLPALSPRVPPCPSPRPDMASLARHRAPSLRRPCRCHPQPRHAFRPQRHLEPAQQRQRRGLHAGPR